MPPSLSHAGPVAPRATSPGMWLLLVTDSCHPRAHGIPAATPRHPAPWHGQGAPRVALGHGDTVTRGHGDTGTWGHVPHSPKFPQRHHQPSFLPASASAPANRSLRHADRGAGTARLGLSRVPRGTWGPAGTRTWPTVTVLARMSWEKRGATVETMGAGGTGWPRVPFCWVLPPFWVLSPPSGAATEPRWLAGRAVSRIQPGRCQCSTRPVAAKIIPSRPRGAAGNRGRAWARLSTPGTTPRGWGRGRGPRRLHQTCPWRAGTGTGPVPPSPRGHSHFAPATACKIVGPSPTPPQRLPPSVPPPSLKAPSPPRAKGPPGTEPRRGRGPGWGLRGL